MEQDSSMQKHSISFGVGCFNFGLKADDADISVKDYVSSVKRALEEIHSTNNVRVEADGDDQRLISRVHGVPTLEDNNIFFPFIDSLEVTFDLYIPRRVQAELTKHIFSKPFDTEHFRIFCRNEFDCPVCFVQPLVDGVSEFPSASVVIVREYLSSEFRKMHGPVRFEYLGPSPFHADFTLRPATENLADGFTASISPSRAYDNVEISYDVARFADVDAAFEDLRGLLSDELDVFYEIVRTRNCRFHFWLELQAIVGGLVNLPSSSIKTRIAAMWGRAARIRQAHQKLAELEAFRIFSQQKVTKFVKDLYNSGDPAMLKLKIQAEYEELGELPVSELSKLLVFLESRRSKSVEMGVVLFAALLGGVAGAALTHMLT